MSAPKHGVTYGKRLVKMHVGPSLDVIPNWLMIKCAFQYPGKFSKYLDCLQPEAHLYTLVTSYTSLLTGVGLNFSRGNFPDWDIPNRPRDKKRQAENSCQGLSYTKGANLLQT